MGENGIEGYFPKVTKQGINRLLEVSFDDSPPILGYNRTKARDDSEVLVEAAETGDPLVAFRRCDRGRVLAYMSDPAPHWGCNFVFWPQYAKFWQSCLDLVLPY